MRKALKTKPFGIFILPCKNQKTLRKTRFPKGFYDSIEYAIILSYSHLRHDALLLQQMPCRST